MKAVLRGWVLFAVFSLGAVMACSAGFAAPAQNAGDNEALVPLKAQATCPITGKNIDRSLSADVQGYRIYAANAKSVDKIKAAPQKAIQTLLLRGEAPEALTVVKPQTQCPIMDDPINMNRYADVNGYRVYVCCRACIADVRADPDKAISKILKAGETPEPRPILKVQSTCPMDGNPIDKDFALDTPDGRKIYACSTNCAIQVKANPQKALERLLVYGEAPESPSISRQVSQPRNSSE